MKKFDIDVITSISLLVQAGLGIFAITFGIASIYVNELICVAQILLGLLLFVIAYNNYRLYKRRYMTTIYLFFGIILLAIALFR